MTSVTAPAQKLSLDLDDVVVLQLLATALARVQRKRRQPKRPAPLHRV